MSQSTKRDYYEILEVSREASSEEIRRAFRNKARTCHPDLHRDDPDAERKFKEINEAYSVLSDAEKRQRYDRFGTAEASGPFDGGFPSAEDLFGSFFGGGFGTGGRSHPNAPQRGADLEMVLSVTLEEAARGVAKKVTIPRWEPCDHCEGKGAEPGSQVQSCPTCGGSGQVRQRMRTIFGETITVGTCPNCGGRGKKVDQLCSHCHGEGRQRRRREQEVKIQPGVDTGTRLRVPGAGDLGANGGPPGDLYIVMEVKDHPDFQREGADLLRRVAIPFPLAVMGGQFQVESLIDGALDFDVAPGTQPGDRVQLRGRGMPRLKVNGRGDLYLQLTVEVPLPRDLSDRGRELLAQLGQELGLSSDPTKSSDEGLLGKIFGKGKQTKHAKGSGKRASK